MSDLVPSRSALPAVREATDRNMGLAVYSLYIAAPLLLGLPALGGMLLAASRKDGADPVAAGHFRFQMWTFWVTVAALAAGGLWVSLGGVGALAPTRTEGAWLAIAGGGLWIAAGVGYLAASLYGLVRLASRSPIGRLFSR